MLLLPLANSEGWFSGSWFLPGLPQQLSHNFFVWGVIGFWELLRMEDFSLGRFERAEVFVKVSNTFLRERKCWWKFLCFEPRQKHTVQIMKLVFITWTHTDFFTKRTQSVGLQIPRVSKYILYDLDSFKASWSCKHKQMVLAGVMPQPVHWVLSFGRLSCREYAH